LYFYILLLYTALVNNNVAFHVRKTASAGSSVTVIPFDTALLNVNSLGRAPFDLVTGVFTAPVSGYYHFDFSGINQPTVSDMTIYIQANNANLPWPYPDGFCNVARAYANGYMATLAGTATLLLNANDQLRLYKTNGVLFEDGSGRTNFSGFLVKATQ